MVERLQVYKCDLCGNIVEVLHGGAGELVCCDQPMKLMEAKIEDVGKEKHEGGWKDSDDDPDVALD